MGAQRSGTTWWFRTLLEHPGIRAARGGRKEVHFFDRFCAEEMTEADIAEYRDLFPRKPGQIAGEWTPRYMRDVWTPRLLARAAPDAKLLVLVRDPIERFRSGVIHRLTRTPEGRREAIATDAVERGRYGSQLRRLLAFYDEERILVLQYERCRQDPQAEYARTLRFLGAGDYEPEGLERPRGTTTEGRKEELWPEFEEALRVTLEQDVQLLAELAPELDLRLWPGFSHLAAADASAS